MVSAEIKRAFFVKAALDDSCECGQMVHWPVGEKPARLCQDRVTWSPVRNRETKKLIAAAQHPVAMISI